MLKTLYNLRPYSWIDLFLLGFLAKFSITKNLTFEIKDILIISGLFFLWCFFNLSLELRHNYSYRAKSNILLPIVFLLLASFIGLYFNIKSVIFVIISTLGIIIYLLKNKNKILGDLSCVFRGIIQSQYYYYALTFYTSTINAMQIRIGISILLLYLIRALIGDIRDFKHNKEANKKTFVVNYGLKKTVLLIEILFLIIMLITDFPYLVFLPFILMMITILFYANGYILHQLMIFVTSFFSINLITYFTRNNLIFPNIIFTGILLNLVFYHLLSRKSNQEFKQTNEISFFLFRR